MSATITRTKIMGCSDKLLMKRLLAARATEITFDQWELKLVITVICFVVVVFHFINSSNR